MAIEEGEKLAAQALANLAQSRGQQIRDALDSTGRTFQIGAVVFSAAIAAIVTNHAPVAVAFLPLPLGLLLAYQQQVYADMMTLAFEQRLAVSEFERLTASRFPVDLGVTRHGEVNPSIQLMAVIWGLVLTALGVVGGVEVAGSSHPALLLLYIPSAVLSLVIVALAVSENNRAWLRCEVAFAAISSGATDTEQTAALRRALGGPMSVFGSASSSR